MEGVGIPRGEGGDGHRRRQQHGPAAPALFPPHSRQHHGNQKRRRAKYRNHPGKPAFRFCPGILLSRLLLGVLPGLRLLRLGLATLPAGRCLRLGLAVLRARDRSRPGLATAPLRAGLRLRLVFPRLRPGLRPARFRGGLRPRLVFPRPRACLRRWAGWPAPLRVRRRFPSQGAQRNPHPAGDQVFLAPGYGQASHRHLGISPGQLCPGGEGHSHHYPRPRVIRPVDQGKPAVARVVDHALPAVLPLQILLGRRGKHRRVVLQRPRHCVDAGAVHQGEEKLHLLPSLNGPASRLQFRRRPSGLQGGGPSPQQRPRRKQRRQHGLCLSHTFLRSFPS